MTPELKTACELVFQEHKSSAYPVTWNRDAFRGRISTGLCEMAKDTLLRKNIIFYPNPAKKIITRLNPAVIAADTFEEADYFILNKIPALAAVKEEDSRNHAPVSKHVSRHVANDVSDVSPFVKRSVTHHLVTITGKTETIEVIKWYTSPLFIYLVWPVCSAVIFWFLSYFIATAYTAIFFDLK
ncbi:MAG: hypothetical protein ACXWWC_14570 [Chitinophagaceae bacterium]